MSSPKKGKTDRIAPGSTETSAIAIVFETLNVDESTTLTVPPASLVALTFERANENGSGTLPCGLVGARASSGGGAIVVG